MKAEDEKFLKDLLWSEVWFPWKRKGILIRKERSSFWEIFAVVVSALALLVSAVATVGTWRQVDLMQAQLTAADRNAATIKIASTLYDACDLISQGPVKAFQYGIAKDAERRFLYMAPVIKGKPRDVTPDEREQFGSDIENTKKEIIRLSVQLGLFADIDTLSTTNKISAGVVAHLNSAQQLISNFDVPYVDLYRIFELGKDCQKSSRDVIARSLGAKSYKDFADKLDPLHKVPELHISDTGD
jgi:hypothetical protein